MSYLRTFSIFSVVRNIWKSPTSQQACSISKFQEKLKDLCANNKRR
eukprot:UN16503